MIWNIRRLAAITLMSIKCKSRGCPDDGTDNIVGRVGEIYEYSDCELAAVSRKLDAGATSTKKPESQIIFKLARRSCKVAMGAGRTLAGPERDEWSREDIARMLYSQ